MSKPSSKDTSSPPYARPLMAEELAALPDEAINTSDIPELDDAFWSKAKLVEPDRTRLVTLRIKQSVLDAFRRDNPKGYQTRMNAVLESYVRTIGKTG